MRAVVDYVVGFVLLVAGIALLRGSGTAVGIAIGVLCAVVGLLLVVGRMLQGRSG